MIFVTVGEQLPFDRLIRTVDECSSLTGQEIFAQIGETDLRPESIKYKKFLDPDLFKDKFMAAELIIAHAGMGTIITALELGKPVLVMPRQAILGEHRNDHQFATAKKFLKLNYIEVAFDEVELREKMTNMRNITQFSKETGQIDPSPLLIKIIREFIDD